MQTALLTFFTTTLTRTFTKTLKSKRLAIVAGILGISILLIPALLATSMAVADVPKPSIPKPANAKQCVEDTKFMRTNHMEVLLHQRDETMRRGIRTKKHSLKNCIACHVVKDANAMPISVANPKHFCRECHDYASVKIDCFECHASKPARKKSAL